MVRATGVLDRVLDKLEARDADRIKGEVIGSAGIADRDGLDAQVAESREPRFEDRAGHIVALEINAADLSGAVVVVVVSRYFRVFGSRLHDFGIGEVLLHIGLRTIDALLF